LPVPTRSRALFLLLPAALVALIAAGRAAAAGGTVITEIEIRTDNVFTKSEAAEAFFPYRLANALHAVSRTSLVEKYLLFKVGDPLDLNVLADTERNLRATGLFRYVLVRAEGTRVIVETADAWTLLLRGSLSRKAGVLTYQAGAEESNLAGTGRELKFLYDKGTERISRSFTFADPAFLRPYTLLRLLYSDLSDGTAYEGRLQRPFYALDTPWSGGVFYHQARFQPTTYAGGEEAASWIEHQTVFRADGGILKTATSNSAIRLLASVEWNYTTLGTGDFGPPPPPAVPPRRFLFLGAAVERDMRRWIQRVDVERIGRVEDINLAPVGRFELDFSPEVSGATGAARVLARGSMGTLIPHGFSTATVTGETRYENGPQNAIVNLDVRAYLQSPRFTFVARVGAVSGWNLDPEVQFYLDGENGLRAYHLHAVSGSGHVVGNLELRTVFFYDVLKLVSFGAAAFADVGLSWGDPDGLWRLADAGVGLRFGLPRSSSNSLLRLDIARAFHADPLGRTGWLVTFASSQAF
jgi:outer membrane protein assembly factor BamA